MLLIEPGQHRRISKDLSFEFLLAHPFHFDQPQLDIKKLFEFQPSLCGCQGFMALRKMDMKDGLFFRNKILFSEEGFR